MYEETDTESKVLAYKDRETMMRCGVFYLTVRQYSDTEWAALQVIDPGINPAHRWILANDDGTLKFLPYDAGGNYLEFVGPDGYAWWCNASPLTGKYRCRRYETQALSRALDVWTTQDQRQLPFVAMEPAHLQNTVRKIMREYREGTKWGRLHFPYVKHMQKILDIKYARGDPERGPTYDLDRTPDVLALEHA